ncbi:MAG TPA: putative glycoside hydrolase [Thermodesulfobacteriota bacterium]|nr:putative glycoside hydrolase [Thermodesulfobacteriota bacterium]
MARLPARHRLNPIVLLIPVSLMFWIALASAADTTRPDRAPAWLYEAETYGLWYSDLASEEDLRSYHVFSLIDWGQPCSNLKWVKELQNSGIRSIAYVSFYKAPAIPDVEDQRRWEGGSPGVEECKRNPFWQAVDLSNHPDWRLIGESGEVKRPFNDPDYAPGWSQVCTNVEGYSEAVLRGVRGIMNLGFDGLFIDNVHPEACFGPQHGRHKHVHGDKNNPETYKALLAEVRRLVKSYGEDKVCVLNSGDLREEYAEYSDGLMWESYIFGDDQRRQDWSRVRKAADDWRQYVDRGKAVLALSYVGGENEEQHKENAFYAYACAKLSGFLWSHFDGLNQTRIGRPIDDIRSINGIHYRIYEKGIVAVNPDREARTVEISLNTKDAAFIDVFTGKTLKVGNDCLKIAVPPDAGRVYRSERTAPGQQTPAD